MAGKKRNSSRKAHVTESSAVRARRGKAIGLFVLGMHRSGTSAITRVLNLLGADLGKRLMEPQAGVNDTGFWEDLEVVALHERLLRWRQSSWFDCRPIPPEQRTSLVQQAAAAEASEIIRSNFPDSALWAIKDPRLCLFVPTWIQAASALTSRLGFVIFVRNPDEVAASLAKRDGITPGHAYLLWGKHVVESVRASAGKPRTVGVYSRLLDDWRREVGSIARNLALDWPVPIDSAAVEVDRFLDVTRRHHSEATTSPEHSDPLHRIVHEIYLALLAIADGDLEWNATDALFSRFDDLAAATAPQIHNLLDHVMSHSDRADKAESALARFVAELDGTGPSEFRTREAQFAVSSRDQEIAIASLSELAASQDRQLGELASRLGAEAESRAVAERQLRNELEASALVVARMDEHVRVLSSEVTEQTEAIAQLRLDRDGIADSLAERESEIVSLLAAVSAAEAEAVRQARLLSSAVADHVEAITQLRLERDRLADALAGRETEVVSLSVATSAAEAEAVKQARQAATNETELLSLSMQRQALEARLRHSQEVVAHREREIGLMLASKSWKATKALRWIAFTWRKLFDG